MATEPSIVRVLILDFDGVVIESNSAKTEAFAEVFSRFPEHVEAMMAYHHANVSESRFAKFEHLIGARLGRAGDTALAAELAAEFSRTSRERIAAAPLVEGAAAFLAEFAPVVPLYLASVTPPDDLADTLERRGLTALFRGIYACPPWTKPGAVHAILEREQCQPQEAMLVGDSDGDRRAAAETGVHFVARDSGLPFAPPAPLMFADMHGVAQHVRAHIS